MIVKFVYNGTFKETYEFEDGTDESVIEEHFQEGLFNSCLPLEVFDTEDMTDEEVDNTLFEYGEWYIED